jgi:hypothetical protein
MVRDRDRVIPRAGVRISVGVALLEGEVRFIAMAKTEAMADQV